MEDGYTPATEVVRDGYARYRNVLYNEYYRKGLAEFDRWLARHDNEVAANTLRAAAWNMRTVKREGHWNLPDLDDPEASYSPDRWLEVYAEQIRKGSDDVE